MTTVKRVENRILKIEGFQVAFCHLTGRDVRGDKRKIPNFKYNLKCPDNKTIADWNRIRIEPNYPGFNIQVFDGKNKVVAWNMMLETIRASYD